MPRINCYIPIRLCITGRLTDAQLEQLSETVALSLTARIAFARRTIMSADGESLEARSIEMVREGYDPTREDAADEAYRVPSYDGGGRPTVIPLRRAARRSQRPWIIRKAINFHALVGDYLDYIENLQRDRPFGGKVLYMDLFDELRWVSAWLVQVNRPFLDSELRTLLYQRAAELSHLRANQIFAFGEAFVESNRQQLIEIDADGVAASELPDISGNQKLIAVEGENIRLNPGALMLFTTMTLPRIELADMASLEAETSVTVRLGDLTLFVAADRFESRYGISWETYRQEFGAEQVTLRLQPFAVRRRIHSLALLYLVENLMGERVRSAVTSSDVIDIGGMYVLSNSTLGQLPPIIRAQAESSTNDATRGVIGQPEYWEPNWKGIYFMALVTISQDSLGAALYRPEARRLLPLLLAKLEGQPQYSDWSRGLYWFLRDAFGEPPETRPSGGTVFEYVLAELESRGELDMPFDKVERANDTGLHARLIRLSLATRYATHARVVRSHEQLISIVLGRRENIYRDREQEIWLDRSSDKRVGVGQVFGEVDSIYVFERDGQRLKLARTPAFREALMIERELLIERILKGEDTNQYTEDNFALATIGAAAQRIHLTNDDFETVTIRRSMRLLRVEARMEAALLRYYITFELVEQVGSEPWQSVSGHITQIEDEFEARLIYWKLGRAGEFYKAMTIAITVVAVIAIAWEAGIIAALVQAAGGVGTLLFSISISEVSYILRVVCGDARLTLNGFLIAALEGYLMALGFGAVGIFGRAVARYIGTESLKRLIGGWVVERLIVGTVGGAGAAALATFSNDLINVATGRGGWSGIDEYIHNMTWGAIFGTVFEFGVGALQPLLRAGGGNALQTLSEVVGRVRAEGFTAVRWTALTAEALGNLRSRLRGIIGDVAAQGFARAMGERLAQVAEQLGGQYRLAVFRRVLELTPGAMSRTAVEGLEKFLNASRADLTNEAALSLLNRLDAAQLRGFLEALNTLDNQLIGAVSRSGQLETIASAPQLAGLLRNDPVIADLILRAAGSPGGGASRVRDILTVARTLPVVPETIQRGQARFFRSQRSGGSTPIIFEVEEHPDLLAKPIASRTPGEARAMVELEMMGIDTVYVGTRRARGGADIILRNIDGVGSKDIIGTVNAPLRPPQHIEVITQRTINDLDRIYQILTDRRANIGDFQFIVRRSDGAIFVNDISGVTLGSSPSPKIKNIIQSFRDILESARTGE
jgi:hypothetical protein